MKKIPAGICLLILAFFIGPNDASAQFWKKKRNRKALVAQPVYDYVRSFVFIDSLMSIDQPKSAMDKVMEVKARASQDRHTGYFIKALDYQVQLTRVLEDDATTLIWNLLKDELKMADRERQMFLHMDMAAFLKGLYAQFMYDNQVADDSSLNPGEWSRTKLNKEINDHISKSLELAVTVPYSDKHGPLISNMDKPDFSLTMEQVMARKAIEVLNGLTVEYPESYKSPAIELAMADVRDFLKADFTGNDDPRNEYRILRLYQLVLRNYHIYFDMERLRYVNGIFPQKTDFFIKACENIINRNAGNPYTNLAAAAIAETYQYDNKVKALEIVDAALKRHPDFSQNPRLEYLRKTILNPGLGIEMETVYNPQQPMLAKVSYNNIKRVFVKVYAIDHIDYLKNHSSYYYNNTGRKQFMVWLMKNKPVHSYPVDLPSFEDYRYHSSEVALPSSVKGHYLFMFSNKEDVTDTAAVMSFNVVSVAEQVILKDKHRIYIVNASNGHPAAGVAYTIYRKGAWNEEKYRVVKKGTSTGNGEIENPADEKNYYSEYTVVAGQGEIMYTYTHYNYSGEQGNTGETRWSRILTDRSIYRPGQVVYFKGIVYDNRSKNTIANIDAEVKLYDNNGEEKAVRMLKTNTYGSMSDSFVLPKGGFNSGSFQIMITSGGQNIGTHFIQVEEYKRPKYKAEIQAPEKPYKLRDHVVLTGEARAFAGYPVSDAKVTYSVVRRLRPVFWSWRYKEPWYGNSSQITLKTEDTITDAAGKFTVRFDAMPDESVDPKSHGYFIYEVNATVTDINGETTTASYSMTMGYSDMDVSVSVKKENLLSKPVEIDFKVNNLQGKEVPFTGKISVMKVVKDKIIYKERLWDGADTSNIPEKDFSTVFHDYDQRSPKEKLELVSSREFKNAKERTWKMDARSFKDAGEYVAIISVKDGRGETVENRFYFNMNQVKPGAFEIPVALSLQITNGENFEPGQTAKLLLGSGAPGVAVRLRAKSERGIILEKEMVLNVSSQLIEIPVTEADRGNIIVTAYTVYNYRTYRAMEFVQVPYTNKQLQLKVTSFRSDLEPGSKERWKVTLLGPKSEKAATEILAGMYDQSLDELYAGPSWNQELYSLFFDYSEIETNIRNIDFIRFRRAEIPWYSYLPFTFQEYKSAYDYTPLNYMLWDFGNGRGGGARARNSRFKDVDYDREDAISVPAEKYQVSYTNGLSVSDSSRTAYSQKPPSQGTIRKNFKETAFFYPHLYANDKGEISFEFTMPEALTKWKLMMLAHSTTMQLGYLEQSVTTSKKVMVQPNMPRFLRQKDKISIPAKIVNTTKTVIHSKVSIKITDEETGKPLDWLTEKNEKEIAVPAGSSVSVNFKLNIPDFTGIVNIAVYASTGDISDGEQHTLAVLSNRMLVTETMPITITKAGTQNLVLDQLKNNASASLVHEKFSIEMHTNPAWYAVQSLPYVMEYPYECAEQIFTRMYANSIAAHLANSDAGIRKVYEAWERESKNGKGLQSKLMQNEDLKSTLLSETPWLNEARNETERMRKLGLLFNMERMKDELALMSAKLRSKQSYNGGWGWFEGMEPNVYVTQTIVIGFGKMQKMGIDISQYQDMISKAMDFIDKVAERNYRQLKKQNVQICHPADFQYVYCKSLFPGIGIGDTGEALQYFIAAAEKTWPGTNLLNRAQLAMALHTLKPSSRVPELIIRSFDENSRSTETMGMYWPSNKRGWYWYEAPVETQAAIMEAYSALGAGKELLKAQQIWLLRQKQTQSWGSTRSTADACYALLMHGNLLQNKQDVRVKVSGTDITPEKKEEGTGYFRVDLPKEKITPSSADIDVSSATGDFAYGAAYWQYFEDIDKISSAGAGLNIGKRIYRVSRSATGDQKIEIKTGDILHAGDIIEVVLTISSDRNLEFVHIKDQRGSGTEPVDVISSYRWNNGLGYYQVTKDASTNFFVDNLPKGNYQLTYKLKVEQAGEFNSGLATAQCMYAPEFAAHSKGVILKVEQD